MRLYINIGAQAQPEPDGRPIGGGVATCCLAFCQEEAAA